MDRRKFIQNSSAGVALGALMQSSQAQESNETLQSVLNDDNGGSDFFTSATDLVEGPQEGGAYFSGGEKPFAIYQLRGLKDNNFEILDPAVVEPALVGNDNNPDVGVELTLAGANFAETVWSDSRANARATIRVTSKSDVENNLDTLHWAITTGLNIYEAYKGNNKVAQPIDLATKLASGSQSLQFKEGAGALQIAVLGHRKPNWWDKVFSFLSGSGGEALIGSLGFPAITQSALKFVDELTNRVENRDRKAIFQASFASVAFSQRGFDGARYPAVLNNGLWLIANPNDKEKLDEYGAVYYGGFARLIPGNMKDNPSKILTSADPFKDITYTVLDAKLSSAKLL